jgi:hypothetical protein
LKTESGKKILVAVRAKDRQKVSRVLGAEFNLDFCSTLEIAQSQLDESIGLIVCGAHFDGGRMFELLRYAKGARQTRAIPFLVVLGSERTYSPKILQGIQIAAKILGADGFIDIVELKEELGEVKTAEALRQLARRILSSDERNAFLRHD